MPAAPHHSQDGNFLSEVCIGEKRLQSSAPIGTASAKGCHDGQAGTHQDNDTDRAHHEFHRRSRSTALQRPRRLLAVPRVRSHRERAFGPAQASSLEPTRVQDLEPLRSKASMRSMATSGAPLRDGRPCVPLPAMHSLDPPAPEIWSSAKLRGRRPRRYGRCLNREPPLPRKAAQLMRPMTGRGAGSMGEVQ